MKKIILLLSICTLLSVSPTLAQTVPVATPTAKITPTPTSGRLDEIKERVEERIQEIKDKASIRAFWGTITQINNSTVTIKAPRGDRRIKVTEETKILVDNKAGKFTDLSLGSFTIVIGDWDNKNETLTAKRFLAFANPPKSAPQRQAIFGKISDMVSDEQILVITHPKKPGVTYEVKVDSKTVISKKVESSAGKDEMKKVKFEDITIGDQAVVVALKDKEGSGFTAKIIHIIPGKSANQQEPSPAPTLTSKPKTSPSPVITKQPTPTPNE